MLHTNGPSGCPTSTSVPKIGHVPIEKTCLSIYCPLAFPAKTANHPTITTSWIIARIITGNPASISPKLLDEHSFFHEMVFIKVCHPTFPLSHSNKLRWYPQQPQRFIFTHLSEACYEAKRWKHLSWVSVSYSKWLQIPLNLTWLCTKASQTFFGTLLNLIWLCTKASPNLPRNLLWNPVEPDLALQILPDLLRNLRNLLRNLVEPEPAPAPVHTGAILG